MKEPSKEALELAYKALAAINTTAYLYGAKTIALALAIDALCAERVATAKAPEHPRDSTDEDVIRVFEGYWLPIFLNDPDFRLVPESIRMSTVHQIPLFVKRELYDYSILLDHVPKVYSEVTGGRVSKPNTTAGAVIGEYEEHVKKLCDQAIEDYREEQDIETIEALTAQRDRLREALHIIESYRGRIWALLMCQWKQGD